MCLFCDIVSGKIPCHRVFENEKVLAFLDIAPVNYGHALVVPKAHYANMEEIPEDALCETVKIVKIVGKALKEGLAAPGYNVSINNDPVSGQVIPHIHFHVIPRKEGDGLKLWEQGKYGNGEALEVLEKIKGAIDAE